MTEKYDETYFDEFPDGYFEWPTPSFEIEKELRSMCYKAGAAVLNRLADECVVLIYNRENEEPFIEVYPESQEYDKPLARVALRGLLLKHSLTSDPKYKEAVDFIVKTLTFD